MMRTEKRLTKTLEQQIETTGRALLVIDGDCAAGKTTLAERLAARLPANVFHMDDFFLPQAMRTEARLHEAGGNVHYERFLEQVLKTLPTNEAFVYGAFSCQTGITRDVFVSTKSVTVIEGSYALHPRFLPAYRAQNAVMVFLRVSPEEQLARIQERNGEAMLRRFENEWIPMEKRYQEAYRDFWTDVRFIDG